MMRVRTEQLIANKIEAESDATAKARQTSLVRTHAADLRRHLITTRMANGRRRRAKVNELKHRTPSARLNRRRKPYETVRSRHGAHGNNTERTRKGHVNTSLPVYDVTHTEHVLSVSKHRSRRTKYSGNGHNNHNNHLRQRRRKRYDRYHTLDEAPDKPFTYSNSTSNVLITVAYTTNDSIVTNLNRVTNLTPVSRFTADNSSKSTLDASAAVGRYVVNRSHATLSHTELTLLDKGLTYVPTETRLNRSRHIREFDNFARKLRIRLRASRRPATKDDTPRDDRDTDDYPGITDHTTARRIAHAYGTTPFKRPSKWDPPKTKNAALEEYITRTRLALEETKPKRKIFQNLTREERIALERLGKRDDIDIKKADKGSMIVVEDRQTYARKGFEHVNDIATYQHLDTDTTPGITQQINRSIENISRRGLIDRDTLRPMIKIPSKVRTQQLYFLSKIHKNLVAYRPIVSESSGPTEAIYQYVDHLLKPIAFLQNSYIRDSGEFVNILEKTRFARDAILVTIDATSLYTNIPQDEAIKTCTNMLLGHYGWDRNLAYMTETLLRHILRDNVFAFDGQIYRQLFGVAMGTRVAPTLANLFMAKLGPLPRRQTDQTPPLEEIHRRHIRRMGGNRSTTRRHARSTQPHTPDDQIHTRTKRHRSRLSRRTRLQGRPLRCHQRNTRHQGTLQTDESFPVSRIRLEPHAGYQESHRTRRGEPLPPIDLRPDRIRSNRRRSRTQTRPQRLPEQTDR